MYTFKLTDPNVVEEETNKVATILPVEFNIITKDEGYDQKKFTKIKKPKCQMNNRKPRNAFLMFRGLVRLPITKFIENVSFVNVSKFSSMLWARRTEEVEHYMKYLAKQDEKHWESKSRIRKDVAKPKDKFSEVQSTSRIFVCDSEEKHNKKFRYYKVNKPTTKLIVRPQKKLATRVQDVFISHNN